MNYIWIDDINDIKYEGDKKEEILFILSKKEYLFSDIDIILNNLISLKEAGYHAFLSISSLNRNFNNDEFAIFTSLEKRLKEKDLNLYFAGENYQFYSLKEVMNSDNHLDKIINGLKQSNLSPFEKYLVIYRYLTKKQYKDAAKTASYFDPKVHLSRDIISVVNSDYIVCEGYSNLMTYLCREVGIHCFNQTLTSGNERHMNNLVFIKDDKYHIDGLYYSDACWDATKDGTSESLLFCLLPLKDVHLLNYHIAIDSNCLFFYKTRNYKMLSDDSLFANIDDFISCRNDYHIEKDLEELYIKCLDIFKTRKDEAIEEISKIYLEEIIKDDIYNSSISYGSSLSFLIALYLLSKENVPLIRHQLKCLKLFAELKIDQMVDERPYYPNEIMLESNFLISVQKTLEELKAFDINQYDLSYQSTYNAIYYDENISYQIKNILHNVFGIVCSMRRMIAFNKIEKIVNEELYQGKPIAFNKYKKAYRKALLFEGLEGTALKQEFKEVFDMTLAMAKPSLTPTFKKGCINCFYNEVTKK